MRTKVKYNGKTISFTEGDRILVQCSGHKMLGDIEVETETVHNYGGEVSTRYLGPGISISGSILTITDYSRCANSINVYYGVLTPVVGKPGNGSLKYTVDLSTISAFKPGNEYTIFASLTHSGVESLLSIAVLYKAGG